MRNWKINLFWTWLSLFLAMIGFSVAYPIFPFMLEDVFNVTDQQKRDLYIAVFSLGGNFGFFLFSPVWGRLADRFGKKAMMTRANFCSTLTLPLLGFMPSPEAQIALRFVVGALAGIAAAAMTLTACFTPEKHRGMALGAISSAIFSGSLTGMVTGGLLVGFYGYTPTFLLCGGLLATATVISHFLIVEPPSPSIPAEADGAKAANRFFPAWGPVWLILLLTLAMGYSQLLDGPFIPVVVKEIMNTTNKEAMMWNGILGGAAAAAGVAGGFIIGTISDHLPGEKVGIAICLLGAVFMLPQYWCNSLPLLFAERMIFIFFVSGLSPIMQTWLSLTTPEESRGLYFGYATSFRALGWIIGGILSAAAVYFEGTRSVFPVGAASLALIAAGMELTHRKIPFPRERKS